jgi:hypothetical protein
LASIAFIHRASGTFVWFTGRGSWQLVGVR